MKLLSILTYTTVVIGYIAIITQSKTIINYLKECVYLFVSNDWEEE